MQSSQSGIYENIIEQLVVIFYNKINTFSNKKKKEISLSNNNSIYIECVYIHVCYKTCEEPQLLKEYVKYNL